MSGNLDNLSHHRFRDRVEAGRLLARKLVQYSNCGNLLVLGMPRGGVPVGVQIARALGCPFDVFIVRKLGVPGQEELAMGAIASGGIRVLNHEVIKSYGLSDSVINAATATETRELERRELAYRAGRPVPDLRGRWVILVDDGVATGSTMSAALEAIRQSGARCIIAATPVIALSTLREMRAKADEFIALVTPAGFIAVGDWYDDFSQTTDEEVRWWLEEINGK
jgi:predicted phosphoribosyltransferase